MRDEGPPVEGTDAADMAEQTLDRAFNRTDSDDNDYRLHSPYSAPTKSSPTKLVKIRPHNFIRNSDMD